MAEKYPQTESNQYLKLHFNLFLNDFKVYNSQFVNKNLNIIWSQVGNSLLVMKGGKIIRYP